MENKTDIVIIGGGISGLSAGINAIQNGFNAIIVESQPYVGGFCTGWYRKGRYLDGCLHWLTGTNPKTDLYKMWKSVHAIENDTEIIYLDSFGSFEYEGTVVTFWKDIKRAEKEWKAISPKDKREIHHFFNMVKDFVSVDTPCDKPVSALGMKRFLKAGFSVAKVWPSYLLSMNISTDRYARKFKHPAIRNAIRNVQPGAGNLFSMLYSYSTIVMNNGGIPKGGSKALAERMKNYYLSLGGTLKLNRSVTGMMIENNKATGVRLDNGEIIYSNYVISTVSPRVLTSKILKDKYHLPAFEKRVLEYRKNPCPSCVLIQFEIEDIPNINIPFTFQISPLKVGTRKIDNLTLRSYAYDQETFVKGNKTIASCLLDQYDEDYFYWESLYRSSEENYRLMKSKLGEEVLKRIYTRFPELEGKIQILDIATPHTMKRYTNSTKGAYMSFLFTRRNTMYRENKINGIDNLILAGQWVSSPGGLPFALMTGMHSIHKICQKEKTYYLLKEKLEYKR